MWSRALADASVGAGEATTVQRMSCGACDRSDTQFDIRQTFTMSSSYELPFARSNRLFGGWKLGGLATARTGLPVNITVSRKASDMLDANASSQRPDFVPGMSI